jgi:hypothetical protein
VFLRADPGVGEIYLSPFDVVLSFYDRVAELTAEDGDTLTTPLLPGCGIALHDLFRAS